MAGFIQVRAEQEMSKEQATGVGEDHVGPIRPVGLNRGQFASRAHSAMSLGHFWLSEWGLSAPI